MTAEWSEVQRAANRALMVARSGHTRWHLQLPRTIQGFYIRPVRVRKTFAISTRSRARHDHIVREVVEITHLPFESFRVMYFLCGASSWQSVLKWLPDGDVCARCALVQSGVTSVRTRRGTSNSNDRGNTTDRRRRREFLVTTFGDGERVPCYRCSTMLTVDTVTADRYPVRGCDGGRYTRDNLRPSCAGCNTEDGSAVGVQRKKERAHA